MLDPPILTVLQHGTDQRTRKQVTRYVVWPALHANGETGVASCRPAKASGIAQRTAGQRGRTRRGKPVTLQEQYDANDGHLVLQPGEYRGPLVISLPGSVIDGRGATIWADHGPVIRVRARNVRLENLRVEIMQDGTDPAARTAIHTLAPDTELVNVEVYGDVTGPVPGAGRCDVPRTSDLGTFASGEQNSFQLHVEVPSRVSVRSAICDVSVEPDTIGPGPADLTITAHGLPNATSLFGDVLFEGAVRRRTCLRGQAMAGAPRRQAPPHPVSARRKGPGPEVNEGAHPRGAASPRAAQEPPPTQRTGGAAQNPAVPALQRGERRSLGNLARKPLRIQLSGPNAAKTDACVFALNGTGRVRRDDDFACSSQPSTTSGAAAVGRALEQPYAQFILLNADSDIDRFVAAFSVCADDTPTQGVFQQAQFTVFSDGNAQYTFAAPHTPAEQTVVAAEIYRYKGEWRLRCVDSGLNTGLDELCRTYGVQVGQCNPKR